MSLLLGGNDLTEPEVLVGLLEPMSLNNNSILTLMLYQ